MVPDAKRFQKKNQPPLLPRQFGNFQTQFAMNVIDSTKQALLLGVDELMDIMFYGLYVIFKPQLYKVSPRVRSTFKTQGGILSTSCKYMQEGPKCICEFYINLIEMLHTTMVNLRIYWFTCFLFLGTVTLTCFCGLASRQELTSEWKQSNLWHILGWWNWHNLVAIQLTILLFAHSHEKILKWQMTNA